MNNTEQLAVDTIKTLAMDAVQRANSGHPGMPMGMADIAAVLWGRYLVVDPSDPGWIDRDRFVLSNGHGSMLLYALLHLAGFPLGLADLENFRQWGYPTAGHPERQPELGIEMTTGPLGQGFGTGVGLAIAEEHLRAVMGPDLIDHRTFGFVSDGDLMEGISAETSSLAGHLGLGRLVYYYDDNDISIDGSTDLTFSENVSQRFDSLGWHTVEIDGHDRQAVSEATASSLETTDRPSLVICHTHIAHGSPGKQDTAGAHGAPLGPEEIRATKEAMGWDPDAEFLVPPDAAGFFSSAMEKGRAAHAAWIERRDKLFEAEPDLVELWQSYFGPAPVALDPPDWEKGSALATRAAGGQIFDQIARKVPGLIGGAADLVESTKTHISFSGSFSRHDRRGRNIHFGVREHAMGTIVNGLALHGGLRPYGATFFIFNDYMRPAVRLSALMDAPSVWVYTHDSIWLGEDGPTHQPIEQLASMRAMPNMWVVRPADATETVEAWEVALRRTSGPTAILLTRQGVPVLDREPGGVARGAYVIREGGDAVLIATGSEVHLALEAAELITDRAIRVVSMPCWEAFDAQESAYRRKVLGAGMPVASLEAAATLGWERWTGTDGLNIGIDRFGASAPYGVIAEQLGFTPDEIAGRLTNWLDAR